MARGRLVVWMLVWASTPFQDLDPREGLPMTNDIIARAGKRPRSDPHTLTARTRAASAKLPPPPPLRLINHCWYTTEFAAENFVRGALGLPLLVDEPAQTSLVSLATLAERCDMNIVTLKRHFKAARAAILA